MLNDLFRPSGLDDFPGPFAARARRVAEELRARWEHTCREAARNRKLAELHAARDEYEALLKGHLQLLEVYLTLTGLHQDAFGPVAVDGRVGAGGRGTPEAARRTVPNDGKRWRTFEAP